MFRINTTHAESKSVIEALESLKTEKLEVKFIDDFNSVVFHNDDVVQLYLYTSFYKYIDIYDLQLIDYNFENIEVLESTFLKKFINNFVSYDYTVTLVDATTIKIKTSRMEITYNFYTKELKNNGKLFLPVKYIYELFKNSDVLSNVEDSMYMTVKHLNSLMFIPGDFILMNGFKYARYIRNHNIPAYCYHNDKLYKVKFEANYL